MAACTSCGAENREEARFCDSCGAALAETAPARETRKTVTVLFCDVTGSTALGERIDPESLRHVMARYFETAKAIVERHGGTVEKFIGDAVMAVFGVPAVHEDDALRAARAADELRGGLDELNDELEQNYGTRLELRMGVNTGEVVTGTEERLATGDAVNVAARLEQAAQPGEVLLGEETYRLVRDGVEVEPAPPLTAKGKAEPLTAYRLLSVQAEAPARRDAAPMVGRERQSKLLEGAFSNVVSDRTCQLFTILGTAGVGKSRLVTEFLSGLDEATILRGRCLSYGDGISYWPVTEVVKQLVPDGSAIGPLASILGDDSAASSPDEIAWAFRKLLESRATESPLVVVFDDVHWGEPTFLDLVEHVADLSRDAPILLLCMARPELLDARPAWGGGKLNATNVLLEPLAPQESVELIESLTGGIDDELRGRILEAAGGNPLFVEEMVAMVPEGGGDVAVPPTIQALLAARLDQLDPAERSVLESGAVEGQVFHRGAVAALAPEETGRRREADHARPQGPRSTRGLGRRRRRGLSLSTPPDPRHRVRGALEGHARRAARALRDVARRARRRARGAGRDRRLPPRAGLPLPRRARPARRRGGRDRRPGGRPPPGQRRPARDRGDTVAAQALLARAVELVPAGSAVRAGSILDLAVIHAELGDFPGAAAFREEAVALATSAQDEGLLARVTLARVEAEVQYDANVTMRGALAQAEEALAVLERLEDEEGAIWGLRLVGQFRAWLGSGADAEALWAQASERAERVSPRLTSELLIWRCWDIWWGATPADEGVLLCNEWMASSPSKRLEAIALLVRGTQKAALKQIEEGRADVIAGRELLHDLGDMIWWAGSSMLSAEMELLAGNAARAYETLADGPRAAGGELRDRLPRDGGRAAGPGRARAGAGRRSARARRRDRAGGRHGRLRAARPGIGSCAHACSRGAATSTRPTSFSARLWRSSNRPTT